jgi:hypothetical protein
MKPHFMLLPYALCLLSGCGGGSPKATLSPSSLTFGAEVEGSTSAAQKVTLSNSGTATLNITSITVTANFEILSSCAPTLASGTSCDLSVTFTPNTSDNFNGDVMIMDNAVGSPQMISLSGIGTAPSCSLVGQDCGVGSLPCCSGEVCSGQQYCGRDNQPCRCEQSGTAPGRANDGNDLETDQN